MRECDRVIYDRPIPPRLLADLAAAPTPDRDWKSVGRDWTATRDQKAELSADFTALQWTPAGSTLSASAGLALREIVDLLKIRKPLAFAESGPGSSQPIIGVRAKFVDRVIQVYLLDRGHEAIVLAVDSFFGADAEALVKGGVS